MSDCHIICSWDMRYHVQRGNEESDYSSAILTENKIIELGITSYYPHCDTTIDDCKAEYPGRKPHDYWPSK